MRRGDRDAFWGSAAHFLKSLITRWKKISSNLAEDDCQHLLAEWKASRACYNTGTSSNHTNPVVSTVNKTSHTVIIYSQPGNKAHPGKKRDGRKLGSGVWGEASWGKKTGQQRRQTEGESHYITLDGVCQEANIFSLSADFFLKSLVCAFI